MKKIFLTILATVLFPLASAEDVKPEKIKIGVQLPLTGDLATNGEDAKNGILLALEDLGADKYQLIIEDDKCSAQTAVSVANKLIHVDKVKFVIGQVCNGALLPAVPLYSRAGVTVISSWATTGDVLYPGKGIFTIFPSDAIATKRLYDYIRLRHKKIAVLTELEEYTALVQRSLKKFAAEDNSGVTLDTEEISAGTADYRSVLTKLLSHKPEAIILNAYSEQTFAVMVKQVRAINSTIPVYGLYYASSEVLLKDHAKVLEGVVFADAPAVDQILNQNGKSIFEKFRAKFGEPKGVPYLFALGYEDMRLVDEAVRSKQDPKSFLRSKKFSGGSIGEYSFDENGQSVDIKLQIKLVKYGKVIVLE